MGVLARTDVQTFDRTHMYETKSYAPQSTQFIHTYGRDPAAGP